MTLDFGAIMTPVYIDWIIWGAVTTMELFALAWVFALLFAALLVGLGSSGLRPLQWLVRAIVEYHRNVPSMVQILVWYFAVPQVLPEAMTRWINSGDSEFTLALFALFLYAGSYMAEDMRSGLRSLPRQQEEASRALGLNYLQTMRDVLLPQAIRASLPALMNQTLVLFKTTSLAMAVGVAELTYSVRMIENETYRTFEAFTVATVFYLTGSLILIAIGAKADRIRLRSSS